MNPSFSPFFFVVAILFGITSVAIPISSASEANALYEEANRLYEREDYAAALRSYEELAERGLASPDLFYNLGATAYRTGSPGEALLWFRRSQVLDPGLPDSRQSIAFLRQSLGFLEFADTRFDRILRRLPQHFGTWLCASLLWITAISVAAAYLFLPANGKRSGMVVLASLFLMLAILGWRLQHYRDERLSPENFAIVTSSQTSALTAPTPDAKEVIALPPGSEVRILQEAGPWRYVNIPGGLRGWIRTTDAESVWPL